MDQKKHIITIDGSGWTGKSSTAKALARILNFKHINTGSMFRAVAWKAKQLGVLLEDNQEIIKITKNMVINFRIENNSQQIFVDGENITAFLLSSSLVPLAGKVAQIPEVRKVLLELQRKMAKEGNAIFEGRDMGTVVFPNADWKFYLEASVPIKIKRFLKMLSNEEKNKYTLEEVKKIIEETDEKDKNREFAPLRKPNNAIFYDNSESPTPEQDAIVLWYYITHQKEIIDNALILQSRL